MSNKPTLSIIIVHYRNPAVLKMCLNSIIENPPVFSHEVIVVDSQTSRESRDIIKELFPKVILIADKKNTGYSRGVNIGLSVANGEFMLILNYDMVLVPESIDKMTKFIIERPDIGLLGPQLLNFDDSIQRSYFRYYKPSTILARRLWLGKLKNFKKIIDDFLMLDTDPYEIQTPDWLMGAALMTSRHALEKVGNMDENFFFYFEDVDWAKRFWQNGYKVVYYPEAKIYHSYGRGSKSKLGILDVFFNKKTRWHIKSAIKFFIKHRKPINA